MLGGIIVTSISGFGVAGLWFAAFWCMSVLDLFLIAKTVESLGQLLTEDGQTPEKKAAWILRASTWGVLKIVCLGLFIFIFVVVTGLPQTSLFLGIGTLVVVPLAGGWLWSQRILKNE